MNIFNNFSLKTYNTFGIEAFADSFIEVTETLQLQEICKAGSFKKMPKLILGGGSNILLTGNFCGLVLKISNKGIVKLQEDSDYVWLRIEAGENWHQLVNYCVSHEYGGIENLSLIPGTVGAAPVQNIGAYGVEFQQVFVELEAMQIANGSFHQFSHQECKFSYRNSIFKHLLKNQFIITSVILKLARKPTVFHLEYKDLKNMLLQMNITEPTLKEVSEAICKIRQIKLPNPENVANAGSFFKNPEISNDHFFLLQKKFPDMPFYLLSDQYYKIPAGWLIEQCGWKGVKKGQVGVYGNHSLVLVNYGEGTGLELKQLANDIQESVYKRFGITLEPEVNII